MTKSETVGQDGDVRIAYWCDAWIAGVVMLLNDYNVTCYNEVMCLC